MKYIVTILLLGLMSFSDGGYEKAMEKNLTALSQVDGKSGFLELANNFERIAKAEKDKWLPYYYAAYAKTVVSTLEEDPARKDGYLDEAEATVNEILLIEYDKVEVLALQSFINMMRISVDPATRGQVYSMKSAEYLEEASAIDENNPRVNLFMGYLMHGSAQFFNADTGPACDKFAKSLKLFKEADAETKPFWPGWGEDQAAAMVKKCAG